MYTSQSETTKPFHFSEREKGLLSKCLIDRNFVQSSGIDSNLLDTVNLDFDLCINILETYCSHLETVRHTFNLIGSNEVIANHIIDCLAPFPIFLQKILSKTNNNSADSPIAIADLGSGAGLPGIPLAITLSACNIPSKCYLLERSQKKANFIQSSALEIKDLLKSTDIFVLANNLKEWRNAPHIDIVCSRAFRPIDQIISDMKKSFPQAEFLFYKGKRIMIEEEFAPFLEKDQKNRLNITEIYSLSHEQGKERHIVSAHWN